MKTKEQIWAEFEAWWKNAVLPATQDNKGYTKEALEWTYQSCAATHETALAEKDAEIARMRLLLGNTAEAIRSISSAMITKPDDFSLDRRDAWIYHILFNWDDAFDEIVCNHKWDRETTARVDRYRKTIETITEMAQTT